MRKADVATDGEIGASSSSEFSSSACSLEVGLGCFDVPLDWVLSILLLHLGQVGRVDILFRNLALHSHNFLLRGLSG